MSTGKDIVVIGGGAAGMMAAVAAARFGAAVTILEKNDRPGRKLRITGKGRCNLTNHCEIEAVLVSNEQKVEYGQPLFRVRKL